MPGLSTKAGVSTGGVYGFASLALEIIKKLEPDYVVVAWDKRGTNIRRRKKLYPDYKANRKPAPDDFYAQIPLLLDLIKALNWPFYECDDYEADDIIGTLNRQANEQGIETQLISSDLDMLQILDNDTKLYAMKKGLGNIEVFDIAHFEQKYGIKINQFLDLKALKGDSSDNVPGVPGVGEKTAIQLLQKYGTLDNVFAHLDEQTPSLATKLSKGKDLAYLSKKLSEIWFNAPVKLDLTAADINNINYDELVSELKELEFNSLLRRMPAFAKKSSGFSSDNNQTALIQNDAEHFIAPDGTLVAYDVKKFLHATDCDINSLPSKVFDVGHAYFLLDPLNKDNHFFSSLKDAFTEAKTELKNYPKLQKLAENFDFPLIPILYKMEKLGVKIDLKIFAEMSQDLTAKLKILEQNIFASAGTDFNVNSPYQLADILFAKLQLPTTGIKKGTRGYSTSAGELEKLRHLHPIIELIEQHRELAKIINTYVDALPKLADAGSRIHTTFTQNVTSTGRLSSVSPNLQNIPIRSELGKTVRTGFVAEKGNVLVSADYSQFELRLAAVLAGDKLLIEDFNNGLDIHTKTASDVFKVPLGSVTKDQRRAAKVINFGVLYGMSPQGLSAATGMNFYESKAFIDSYFALRAPIRTFIDRTLQQAVTDGYVETFFGRRRPTPDVKSNNFIVREAAKRAAANMPIQGTEADLMKRAMIKLESHLAGLGNQILQIHDSILVECPAKNAEKVSGLLKTTMESIAPELKVKLSVDVSVGQNWGEL